MLRILILLLLLGGIALGVRSWLNDHPEHNPWAPLHLDHPPGWATQRKLADLRSEAGQCQAVLDRSDVGYTALEPAGEGECRRESRLILDEAKLSPDRAVSSCAVAAAYAYWMQHGVQPAAREILGAPVMRVEHLGTYSCRRLYGRDTGRWSEHATGNAIDIAAFVLEDGRRISLLTGWDGESDEAAFLRRTRDAACDAFGTVLSPDYNEAHADHLHLDQQERMWGVCR